MPSQPAVAAAPMSSVVPWRLRVRQAVQELRFNPDLRVLAIVHLNIVAYAAAYWLVTPLMPFLLKEHGASSLSLGVMQSLFNLVQLGGSLVVGFLQDHYSGSFALSVTQVGSMLVYGCVGGASSLTLLYLSRLPTVLQQSMQVAQGYVSKRTSPRDRTVALSRLSISYTVGMITGSALSGQLSAVVGNQGVAFVAAVVSLLCAVGNAVWLDASSPTAAAAAAPPATGAAPATPARAPASSPSRKQEEGYGTLVWSLRYQLVFVLFLFAVRSLYEPVSSLLIIDKYGFTKTQVGPLTSGMAGCVLVSNVVLLPLVLRYTTEDRLTKVLLAVGCVLYVGLALAPPEDYRVFLAVALSIACVAAQLYSVAASYMVRNAPTSTHGRVTALSHALRSGVGIVCPLLGTALLERFGGEVVAGVNVLLLVVCSAVLRVTPSSTPAAAIPSKRHGD